jgi:hypothetical protein
VLVGLLALVVTFLDVDRKPRPQLHGRMPQRLDTTPHVSELFRTADRCVGHPRARAHLRNCRQGFAILRSGRRELNPRPLEPMHLQRKRRVCKDVPLLRLAHLTTWRKQSRFATFPVLDLPQLTPRKLLARPNGTGRQQQGMSSAIPRRSCRQATGCGAAGAASAAGWSILADGHASRPGTRPA